MTDLTVLSRTQAVEHGLPPTAIRVDAQAAGLAIRLFPTKDVYLALNGPPGLPLVVVIWSCAALPNDVEAVIRAKLVPPWARELEIGPPDRGMLLGGERTGLTFPPAAAAHASRGSVWLSSAWKAMCS